MRDLAILGGFMGANDGIGLSAIPAGMVGLSVGAEGEIRRAAHRARCDRSGEEALGKMNDVDGSEEVVGIGREISLVISTYSKVWVSSERGSYA